MDSDEGVERGVRTLEWLGTDWATPDRGVRKDWSTPDGWVGKTCSTFDGLGREGMASDEEVGKEWRACDSPLQKKNFFTNFLSMLLCSNKTLHTQKCFIENSEHNRSFEQSAKIFFPRTANVSRIFSNLGEEIHIDYITDRHTGTQLEGKVSQTLSHQ